MCTPARAIWKPTTAAVLLAQLLSVGLAVTGISSKVLAEQGINAPTLQSFLNYLLLALVWGPLRWCMRRPLSYPLWLYAAAALIDVEANYLVTKAYQYTSLTSVSLLDCFSVPAVMLLSALVLRRVCNKPQLAGALLCVAGLVVLVISDQAAAASSTSVLFGDVLVICGAMLYAASNVSQEALLGAAPFQELLAMVGCWGALLSALQVVLLERDTLGQLQLQPSLLPPFFSFAAALFGFYSIVPFVLMWGGATLLNLSLLTSDLWTAAARMAWFGGFGGTLPAFLASLALVATGLVVFTCFDPGQTSDDHRHQFPTHAMSSMGLQRQQPRGWWSSWQLYRVPQPGYVALSPRISSDGDAVAATACSEDAEQQVVGPGWRAAVSPTSSTFRHGFDGDDDVEHGQECAPANGEQTGDPLLC